jgi:hypothetical protein
MNVNTAVFLVSALTMGSIGTGAAQTPVPAVPPVTAAPAQGLGPRIQFETPIYDFGKITSGDIAKHTFIFTNTGDQTLEITDVKPGCGCTTTSNWDRKVEPGKTGSIPIAYNSANYGGPIIKSVTVYCNVPAQPTIFLQFKGNVWKPIDVAPMYAIFTPMAEEQTNETKVVRITNNTDEDLTLSPPEFSNPGFQVEVKPIKPGKEFELHVSRVPPFGTVNLSVPITIKTSSKQTPVLNISAIVMLKQLVEVLPNQITLQAPPLASPVKQVVTIRNNGTNNLVLSEPTASAPGVDVQVQEMQPGHQFTLSMTFPAG